LPYPLVGVEKSSLHPINVNSLMTPSLSLYCHHILDPLLRKPFCNGHPKETLSHAFSSYNLAIKDVEVFDNPNFMHNQNHVQDESTSIEFVQIAYMVLLAT
jgi:hypothetical protein